MNLNTARIFIFITVFIQLANGSFLQAYTCDDQHGSEIANFVTDVGLDEDLKMLKFFFNTKVKEFHHLTGSIIEIFDVNYTTNTYTTFHAEIMFRGKLFWEENKRLCDMVAVKNVSTSEGTARYNMTHDSGGGNINAPAHIGKRKVYYGQDITCENCLSELNSTIESIFGNSTGDLIQCPLYSGDSFQMYYEVDVSEHYRGLGSYTAMFSIISNDEEANVLQCDKFYVTTVILENLSLAILIGTLVFMVVTGILNFFIVIYSSYQESSNPLLFTASTICNEELLNQLEATLLQLLRYLQFALFMAGLDLQYPGYFQPLMIDIRWCALLGIIFFNKPNSPMEIDNVYTTLNSTGLKNLAIYSTNQTENDIWQNFIICLVIWILAQIVFQFIYEVIKMGYNRIFNRESTTNLKLGFNTELVVFNKFYYQFIGSVLSVVFQLFAVPFLTLTMYMLATANSRKFVYNYWTLLSHAFDTNISYDELVGRYSLFRHGSNSTRDGLYKYGKSAPIPSEKLVPNSIPLVSIICGSILLFLWAVLFFYFTFNYIITIENFRIVKNKKISKLYSSMKTIAFWAFSYHTYLPDKVYYVVIHYAFIIFRLIIVGCLQNHGITQVVLFVITELSNILVLLFIRPYYLNLKWTSTQIIMPVARLLIAILNILYIRSLNFTEEARTYVSFAQIAVHCAVAFIFLIKLVYCVSNTIANIIKTSKEDLKNEYGLKESAENFEDLIDDFEYYPISVPRRSYNMIETQTSQIIEDEDVDNENLYYRKNSERLLESEKSRNNKKSDSPDDISFMDGTTNKDLNTNSDLNSDFDECSFTKQQYYSNLRRRRNDYTFREGDLVYHKYFCDSDMDPEVQELWQSRKWTKTKPEARQAIKTEPKPKLSNFIGTIRNKINSSEHQTNATKKGFEVSRPKQIVVKKTSG